MFEIRWARSAYDNLARIWMVFNSERRAAITRSVATIEAQLATDPMTAGESRERPTRRVLQQSPVGIDFHIDESNRVVKVFRI
jgi:plasmid stabilization system protein ParE